MTLSYFQIPPLTIPLPKAFGYLFHCPTLFPYCLPHLFILAAFSFLAVGLHTATLPPLPFLPSSLHPHAFAPCPASPLSHFAPTQPEPCGKPCSHAAPRTLPTPTCPTAVGQTLAPVRALPSIRESPGFGFAKPTCPERALTCQALAEPPLPAQPWNRAVSVQKAFCSNHSCNFRITPLAKEKQRRL